MKLSILLFGMVQALRVTAWRYPAFAKRLKERNICAQFGLQDASEGRWLKLDNGKIRSGRGFTGSPDVSVRFKNRKLAERFLTPPFDHLARIDAMKNFKVSAEGSDELVVWLMATMNQMLSISWKYGTDVGDGVTRYTSGHVAGPVFVYVKNKKILRITPIEFDSDDAPSWQINARGKTFTPPRQTTLAPFGLAAKSNVYSNNRVLHPMKRVDFDPDGERNVANRGVSGFERISWDEALDIVAKEIRRAKAKGPGGVCVAHGSHHQWGNVGHYLSAARRFFNLIGATKLHHNPDSWEGWFWGAMHHWGNSLRLGGADFYGTVEDCLKEAEMIVFWSSDPESSMGYGSYEGTLRRSWARELGIKMVHIDPYMNETAALFGGKWISPRPGSDAALAQAICFVWIVESLYDEEFVKNRTTGFAEWKAYVLGETDGVPKTPEWQESETGVPAREVRALAREWGSRKTYLGAGGQGNALGGAGRSPMGIQWARMMTILGAMQGLGRPGVNFGNLQFATPLDYSFYFPGYAEGGMSGDLQFTASAANNYQRMPHLLTVSSVRQIIPRTQLPEAILNGQALGYLTDTTSVQGQFQRIGYPSPGCVPIQMLYRYGGPSFGTMNESNRWVRMYQSENLPFVVNQSIWHEGETRFADIILPACTSFERWDIGEWMSVGAAYIHHMFAQANHRVISLQHKCIEPLGESRSDYDIFLALAERLNLGAMYSEGGNSELEWCKRVFESSDVAQHVSWRDFLKKGYFVVPPEPEETRAPVSYRWFYEGKPKNLPEPYPLPSDYKGNFGEGLQTTSGKFEFVPETLRNFDDPGRPAVNRYMPNYEDERQDGRFGNFPLQLLTPHSRYTYHVMGDDKDSSVRDIKDHRVRIGSQYFAVARISRPDAVARGIRSDDLIRLWNDRGSVVCAAYVTERLRAGVVSVYQASSEYTPTGEPGNSTDLGGCVNSLTSSKPITDKTHSMAPNTVRIQVEKWQGVDSWKAAAP